MSAIPWPRPCKGVQNDGCPHGGQVRRRKRCDHCQKAFRKLQQQRISSHFKALGVGTLTMARAVEPETVTTAKLSREVDRVFKFIL